MQDSVCRTIICRGRKFEHVRRLAYFTDNVFVTFMWLFVNVPVAAHSLCNRYFSSDLCLSRRSCRCDDLRLQHPNWRLVNRKGQTPVFFVVSWSKSFESCKSWSERASTNLPWQYCRLPACRDIDIPTMHAFHAYIDGICNVGPLKLKILIIGMAHHRARNAY